MALASFLILLAYIINGNIFGEMAVLIQVLNKKSDSFTQEIDNATSAMEKIMLPEDLSADIRNYLVLT